MKPKLAWVLLGVAAPAVLLGAGWMWASFRERASLEREQEALLHRTAAVVRGVVDESLEELRAREDARPFYLYNHYYSPPDVLAVNDPVAVSPLAHDPDDPRIVGWWQVEPGGAVRTPCSADPGEAATEREARLVRAVAAPSLSEIRALAGEGPAPTTLLARVVMRDGGADVVPDNAGAPSGPLTVSLNPWGNQLAEDIQLAQAGSVEASYRVQQRGRQAPITNRNTVDVAEIQAQQQAPEPQARRWTRRPRPAEPTPQPPLAQQTLEEVDYTEMAFFDAGESPVLHRVVSHEGTAVVQGALLDRAYLVETWIPEIVRRHAPTDVVPVVIDGAGEEECAVRAPASDVLDGVALCFPAAPLSSATARMDRDLALQAGVLVVLLALVLLAAFTVHRASARAAELSRERAAFVSAVSHELRTPLTTLRMHAEMLQDGLVSDARRPRVYEDLVTESARLARLVENVLELSRLEEGRRPMQIREGRLGIYVHDLGEGLRRFVEAKGFALRLIIPEPPVRAHYDAQAVEQIVTNLVDNAVKYAADSEPREIEVEVGKEAAMAFVRVGDRGPGIPETDRERVFERFHRVDRPENAHTPGTGIGLSLVRDFARAMGGDAVVRGREGGGTDVVITLPGAG